jgi:RHS repeat-associated protein
MKTSLILSFAMTMAMGMIAGLQASVTEHQPPAPLPEFKTPEQLAKWRAETKAKTSAQEASRPSTLDSSTPFYTGKPFLAESGSYAFKYREYNPEMGRWITVDPSGFPDGANNRMYVNNKVLISLDNNGLEIIPYSYQQSSTWYNYTKATTILGTGLGATGGVIGAVAGAVAGNYFGGEYQATPWESINFNPPSAPPGEHLIGSYIVSIVPGVSEVTYSGITYDKLIKYQTVNSDYVFE